MLQLTENATLFEVEPELDYNNFLIIHRGFIRIDDIALYQQFRWETVDTDIDVIRGLCDEIFDAIHDGEFRWIRYNRDLDNYQSNIMVKIIARLQCIRNPHNEFDAFVNYVDARQFNDLFWARLANVDEDEYQLMLTKYIIRKFIDNIGLKETLKLFAKHLCDIIYFLFYRFYFH